MKVFIELPTWLGDTIMTTPAIENLTNHFNELEISLLGSYVSTEVLKNHPSVKNTYINSKNYFDLFCSIKAFGEFDLFISFRSSLRSKILKFFIKSKEKYQFDKDKFSDGHQVEKYNNFLNKSLSIDYIAGELKLHKKIKLKVSEDKVLGINPGASYGVAKRWYPEKFAEVAKALSNEYKIIIFGGPQEQDIAADIERYLIRYDVTDYQNLANKTSINELINKIANLDLLITGDSGPMHIAAALKVPTIAIFGPTSYKETSQWLSKNSKIVNTNLDCQPCMQRKCPLKHHNCMKLIDASDILAQI
tara:strand:- start:80 stop:994 length:915 start_codon:yes stop_codon:yes gene_type:complete